MTIRAAGLTSHGGPEALHEVRLATRPLGLGFTA
ncbi:MAG: hypothetical protein JWO98_5414 [Frankiales bacterium]|nr:hypothetical protein [Frankiales bacterium]